MSKDRRFFELNGDVWSISPHHFTTLLHEIAAGSSPNPAKHHATLQGDLIHLTGLDAEGVRNLIRSGTMSKSEAKRQATLHRDDILPQTD